MSEERDGTSGPDGADDLDTLDELLGLEPEEEPAEDHQEQQQTEDETPPQPRQPTRAERRIRALREDRERLAEENRRLRDLALSQTRQPAPQQPDPYHQAEAKRLEDERVAQMMPHEASAYYANKAKQEMSNEVLRARVEVADILDQQNFRQICRDEPMAEKLSTEVDNLLARYRAQGSNPTRESLYNILVAQQVRPRLNRTEIERQRRRGRASLDRERTRPGASRSNVGETPRGRGEREESWAEFTARLKSVTIGEV